MRRHIRRHLKRAVAQKRSYCMGLLDSWPETPTEERNMAKKGEKRDTTAARAARAAKGKRDLGQDRWKLQTTITLPVDSDLTPNALKKQIEDAGGSFSIKSRRILVGYQQGDEEGDEDVSGNGSAPSVEEIESAAR